MANKPHKSVGNERDELFALLKEASFTYRKEVIGESKLYELYVEDFLNGHYYSDHRDAAGKNRHWKNIGILRGILTKRKDLVNPEKPDVPLNKNDAFQKVQKRRVQEKR